MVRTILEILNPLGIVGAGGTMSVADGSLSPVMFTPVTLTAVRASGSCTVICVSVVVPAGVPLTYSVYESAAGLASHANVTVRSAASGSVRQISSNRYFIRLVLLLPVPCTPLQRVSAQLGLLLHPLAG